MGFFLLAAVVACPSLAKAEETTDTAESAPRAAEGILPSLSSAWIIPESLRLRYPDAAETLESQIVYTRRFPRKAQEAIDRGFSLPEPYGVAFLGVSNRQEQRITQLEVALGRAVPPPPDTELVPIPFVALQNVISDTDSLSLKGDVWVLPLVNLFASVARVEGDVDLDVVIDPADVLPPPACSPINPCDDVRAAFTAGVDTFAVTVGATAVYGWDNWFTSGTLSGTASFGENAETTIRSYSVSARFGRRWAYGRGNIAAPYIGLNYFNLDQTVEGVTRLNDAFPNGDSLEVRYKARVENIDKWAAAVGLNLGFVNGYAINGEYSFSENNDRFVLAGSYRF